MVPMKNKVLQFPKSSASQTDAAIDEPQIVFSLGDVRLAIQYKLIQVNCKPAEVVSIHKRSKRKIAKSKLRSQ
jgi:hypothetical protein